MDRFYRQIKQELVSNEVYKKAKDYSKNRSDLNTYYNVGRLIVEAQGGEERAKYGDKLIIEYARRLTDDLGIGYSARNLKRMRKFYLYIQKGTTVSAKLTWSHYSEVLGLEDMNIINYYIKISEEQNLSIRELRNRIRNNEYQRLDENTKLRLVKREKPRIEDFIKNPILIKNGANFHNISERLLKQLILEDIDNFLMELGSGFCYIKNEYKIKLGDRYNYIDLLLYNIKFKCYVVVELKVTELKAEYIGQIQKYMNYVDRNIRSIDEEQTIGIIICRKDNQFIMEYCSDERIFRTTYLLNIA